MDVNKLNERQKAALRKLVLAVVKIEKEIYFATGLRLLFLREWWRFDARRIQAALDAEHGIINPKN